MNKHEKPVAKIVQRLPDTGLARVSFAAEKDFEHICEEVFGTAVAGSKSSKRLLRDFCTFELDPRRLKKMM
jgi:hypothetical protein